MLNREPQGKCRPTGPPHRPLGWPLGASQDLRQYVRYQEEGKASEGSASQWASTREKPTLARSGDWEWSPRSHHASPEDATRPSAHTGRPGRSARAAPERESCSLGRQSRTMPSYQGTRRVREDRRMVAPHETPPNMGHHNAAHARWQGWAPAGARRSRSRPPCQRREAHRGLPRAEGTPRPESQTCRLPEARRDPPA